MLPWMCQKNTTRAVSVQNHNFITPFSDLGETRSCFTEKFWVFPLLPSGCSALSNSGQKALLVAKVTAYKHAANQQFFNEHMRRFMESPRRQTECSYSLLDSCPDSALGCLESNLARKPPCYSITLCKTGLHLLGACIVLSQSSPVHWVVGREVHSMLLASVNAIL